jgi:HAD superfamily phosphoserine phosphatase-like hydrolase
VELPRVDTRVSSEDEPIAVPASYFDVDGTLVRTNLLHPTLFYLLNQRTPLQSLGKIARTALRAPRLAVAELQDRRLFNELLFSAYEGMSRDRLLLLADEAFDTVIKRALYPHAKDLIARTRSQGHDVILVSGALDFLMDPLAKFLGATSFIANRLEFARGIATGKLLRRRPGEGAPHS